MAEIFENYNKKSSNESIISSDKCIEKPTENSSEQQSNATSVIKFVGKLNIDTDGADNISEKSSFLPEDCSVIVNNNCKALKTDHQTQNKTIIVPEENALDSPVYKPLTLEPPRSSPFMEPLQLMPPQDNISIYRQLLSPYLKSAAKSKSNACNQTQINNDDSTAHTACASNNNSCSALSTKGNIIIINKPPKKMYDKNEIYRSIMGKQ